MHRSLSVIAALLGIGVFAVLLNAQNGPADAAGAANLYVTQSVTPLRERQILGGTTAEPILRVTLRADNQAVTVTRLRFTNTGDGTASVERLDLYRAGEQRPFGAATIAGCGTDPVPASTFCYLGERKELIKQTPLNIAAGMQTDILVKPVVKTDVNGAVSGHGVRLRIYPEDTSDPADGAVAARTSRTNVDLLANDGDSSAEGEIFIGRSAAGSNVEIMGRNNTVVLAKITGIVNANPDMNGTMVPSGPYPLGQFKITTAPNSNAKDGMNKVGLTTVFFNIGSTNVSLDASAFKGYNKADPTSTVGCFAYDAAGNFIAGPRQGSFFVSCAFSGSPAENMIDQNTSQTFVLQGSVLNPRVSASQTSALQVSLQNFSDPALAGSLSIPTSHFGWQDTDAGNTNAFFWVEYPETTVNSTSYQS